MYFYTVFIQAGETERMPGPPEPSLAAAMVISRVVGHIVWCPLTANNDYIHKWLSLKRDMLNNTAKYVKYYWK